MLVFLYGVGALRLSQSILSYEFLTERRVLKERLTIVDVWFHDGEASVAVFNHGPTPVRVVGLYVNDTPLQLAEPVEVEAGCLSWVNASFSYQLGAVYRVKVTTELGGEAVAEARAPGVLISVYERYPVSYEMLKGIYVSGLLPESLKEVDGDCFVADAEPIQAEGGYTPSWLSALKASSVQGTVEKLSSNDNDYLVVEPALPFPIRIYAHTETITVGVKTYFLFKEAFPDGPSGSFQAGTTSTGYYLLRTADGRDASFLYPLGKISELPSGTWCFTYRAIRSGEGKVRVKLCVDVSIIDSSGSVVMKLAEKEALTPLISDRYWNTYAGWWSFYGLQLEPSHAYLKVDYYAYVSVAGSGTVYLVVDDPDLGPDDNTMVGTWNAPSSLRARPTSGDGFISCTSQANVEQLVSQEIASNPERFRDADGSWRMLINATATSPFKAYFDHVFYNATYAAYYVVQPAFTFTGLKTTGATVKLAVDMASNYSLGSLPVEVALWNYRASRWDVVYTYISNPTPGVLDIKHFEVTSGAADYVSGGGEARLYVKATSSTRPFRQWIDMLRLTQHAR